MTTTSTPTNDGYVPTFETPVESGLLDRLVAEALDASPEIEASMCIDALQFAAATVVRHTDEFGDDEAAKIMFALMSAAAYATMAQERREATRALDALDDAFGSQQDELEDDAI